MNKLLLLIFQITRARELKSWEVLGFISLLFPVKVGNSHGHSNRDKIKACPVPWWQL